MTYSMRTAKMLLRLAGICFFCMLLQTIRAQNCTVNAGIDYSICASGTFSLSGGAAGLVNTTPNYTWDKISGPACTITSASSLVSGVTDFTPGSYTFRVSAVCQDGVMATDLVNISVLTDVTIPNAGPDQAICKSAANLTTGLTANVPGPGETGKWTFVSGISNINIPSNTLSSTTTPNTNLTVTSTGVKQLVWQISNGVCAKNDTIEIRVLTAQPSVITAGRDSSVSCSGDSYLFPNTTLGATDPGISPQIGSWSVVTAPSLSPVPIFSNVNSRSSKVSNLVTGLYIFRWTISGPCSAPKTADVHIMMANTSAAPVSGAITNNTQFCANENISQLILSSTALSPNETASWTPVGNPATSTTIVNPNRPSTIITGFDGVSTNYRYQYSVTNTNTGCISVNYTNVIFMPDLSGLSYPADREIGCAAVLPATDTISFNFPWPLGTTVTGLTRNIALISAPTGVPAPTIGGVQTTAVSGITTDKWPISNLTAVGRYVFRVEYRSSCGAEFRNITLYTSGASGASNAGSAQVLACNVTSTSLIGNLPTIGVGAWTQISGPNNITIGNLTSNTTSVVSGLIPGNYVFRWNIASGNKCASAKDDVRVTVASFTVTQANAGADRTVCPGGGIKLNGNTPGNSQTGTWTVTPPAGTSFSNINDPSAVVYGLNPATNYTFTWRISNACSSSVDDVVISTSAGIPIVTPNAGADQCLAGGTTSITLTGNNPASDGPYWRALGTGTIGSPALAGTTAIVPGNGTYLFEYSINRSGCATLADTIAVTVSLPTSAAFAGQDQNICLTTLTGSATLTATVPAVGVGTWSQTNGGGGPIITNPGLSSTSISNLWAGVYTFTYTITNGVCPATSSSMTVALSQQPTPATTGPNLSICSATSTTNVTMSANTPSIGVGYWTVVQGPPGSAPVNTGGTSATTPNAILNGFSNGTYIFRWNISSGPACPVSYKDVNVVVSQASNVTSTTSVCAATEVQLIGNTGSNGTWSWTSASNAKPAGAPDPLLTPVSHNSSFASNLSSGSYTFTYTLPAIGSCAASSSIRSVNVATGAPSAANAGPDFEFCAGTTTATLTGNTPSVGVASWTRVSGPNTPTPGIANADRSDTALTNLVPGIYKYIYTISLTGVNAACPASVDSMIIIKEISANAGPDIKVCNVTSGTLTAATPVVYPGTWTQVSPSLPQATIELPSSPTTPVSSLVPGVAYSFRYTINSPVICGPNSDDVVMTVSQPFAGTNAGNDSTVCTNTTPFTIGTSGQSGITYSWSPAAYLSSTTNAQPMFTGLSSPGTYYYTLTTSNGGCTASDAVLITVTGPLQPLITAAKSSVCVAATTTLTISNIQNGVVYNWDNGLGSGTSKTVPAGTYTVTPVMGSCTGTSQTITVGTDPLPLCSFGVFTGCSTNFVAISAGSGASYSWNFGSAAMPATAVTSNTSYQGVVFTTSGQKTATLTVTSSKGCVSTLSQNFTQSCILPISLVSFDVTKLSTTIARINWQVSNAISFRQFVLERSADGVNFSSVGTIAYVNGMSSYESHDALPATGDKVFYRLRMEDNDGAYKYSGVKYLQLTGVKTVITIVPNPFTDAVHVMLPASVQTNVVLRFSDINGKLLKVEKRTIAPGNHVLDLNNLAGFQKGTYLLQVITDSGSSVYKVVHL